MPSPKYLKKNYRGENVVVQRGVEGSAGQFAPSLQARRHTSAPAARGPRRGFVPQAQAALQRFKHALAVMRPPRIYGQRLELLGDTSPRMLTCTHCTDKACISYSAPLRTFRVVLILLSGCPRQGRRRPTPGFCAAGEGGVTTAETCANAAAKLWLLTRTR
jgi:hypothetical protein